MRTRPAAGCGAHARRRGPPMRLLFLAFAAVALALDENEEVIPTLSEWRLRAEYPIGGVFEAGGGILGTRKHGWWYIVFGGFYKFPGVTDAVHALRLYPRPASKFTTLRRMPEPLTHMAQAYNGRYFYGAGGFLGRHPGKSVRSVWRYDLVLNRWTKLPDLPGPRGGGGLVLVGRRWLVYSGGVNRPYNSISVHIDHATTWSLDTEHLDKGWRNDSAPIPLARNHLAAVTSCGRHYWVAGQKGNNEVSGNTRAVTEYIPWQRKWITQPPRAIYYLPNPFGHVSASVLPYRCGIIVVGGIGQRRKLRNQVLWWNRQTNKWHVIGVFPKPVATPVCGLIGNHLICGTGETTESKQILAARLL